MEMLQKRLAAFMVFQNLKNEGHKIPKENPSEDNIKLWRSEFEKELYKYKDLNQLRIPLFVVWTTTQCTLNCKYCGNYIPLLKKNGIKYRYKFEDFKDDFEIFINSVDYVRDVVFAGGGETLLTSNLEKFICQVLKYEKVHYVTITTNGSVLPSERILLLIKNNPDRIYINISNYEAANNPRYTEKRQKVIAAFENVSKNLLFDTRQLWIQTSLPKLNYRDSDELKNYFNECMNLHATYFTSLWNGKVYTCPRQGIWELLGYSVNEDEYINLKNFSISGKSHIGYNKPSLRDEIISFFSKEYYNACNYCNNIEDAALPFISPGEQE